ncbi:MAG: hypothetical protein AB1483_10090 [Candidatus Zixiibacteriota bacterium]
MRTRHIATTLAIFLLLACGSISSAQDSTKSSTLFEPLTIRKTKLNLIPFLSAAMVVGEASQKIEQINNEFSERLLWSGGLSLVYHPKPVFSIGLNLEYFRKHLPGEWEAIRGGIISGSLAIYSLKHVKSIPYVRIDFGIATGTLPDYSGDDDLGLGTHTYGRAGVGVFIFRMKSISTRIELYYSIVFSGENKPEGLDGQEIGFDAERVGLEIGLGIPLLTR